MAIIGWIDFSPSHRNRIGSVLDLLRPEGMVDELGMGTIRDALANQMLPGISTIQTRAKYYFIIPYILYDYQISKPAQLKGRTASKYLEDREYELMWKLADDYNHEDRHGVIGITMKKPNKVLRRPSAIYWNGLFTYQFINTHGLALESFLKQAVNPSMESLLSNMLLGDDLSGDDDDAEHENIFRIKVPPKLNWNEHLTMDLDIDEAEFFRDQIKSIAKNKLISVLLENDKVWQKFLKSPNFIHFAKTSVNMTIGEDFKNILILSHDFSELMYGAHLAYNSQLQNKKFKSDYYDDEWNQWLEAIKYNMLDYENFSPELLFNYAIIKKSTTKLFVTRWWDLTKNKFPDLQERDHLIEQQEAGIKGAKARLRYNKTDDVQENKWIGLKHLDYRFRQVRTIISDIREGLGNEDATS